MDMHVILSCNSDPMWNIMKPLLSTPERFYNHWFEGDVVDIEALDNLIIIYSVAGIIIWEYHLYAKKFLSWKQHIYEI